VQEMRSVEVCFSRVVPDILRPATSSSCWWTVPPRHHLHGGRERVRHHPCRDPEEAGAQVARLPGRLRAGRRAGRLRGLRQLGFSYTRVAVGGMTTSIASPTGRMRSRRRRAGGSRSERFINITALRSGSSRGARRVVCARAGRTISPRGLTVRRRARASLMATGAFRT